MKAKFSQPLDSFEANLEMKVLEDRDDRVLVEELIGLPFNPTKVYMKNELIIFN